jgi:hypothetical protein
LRIRGAASAFELALAGVYLRVSDGVLRLADRGCQHILDVPDYTTFAETVNGFL